MSATPETFDALSAPPPPSPVSFGEVVADRWIVGPQRYAQGDVHFHACTDRMESIQVEPAPQLRIAVFRYRGSEPLPRFLDALKFDAASWGALRPVDGRLPVVVPTLDVGRMVNSTTCYWAQEDPRGPSLAQRLESNPTLAPEYACRLAWRIGEALDQIHATSLVHGDLDPSNVHILGTGEVRLAWGGLAGRLEWAGMDAGRRSLAEVAPEVLQGKPVDPRSDVYSVAALLYRMVAGQPPWLVRRKGPLPGVTPEDSLPPLPPWAGALEMVLGVALQRDPILRPESVGDWLDLLGEVQERFRSAPPPIGTWAPDLPVGSEPTPPSVNRTISPLDAGLVGFVNEPSPTGLDPVLSNTPPSGSRGTPVSVTRSVAPLTRVAAPPVVALESASQAVRTVQPSPVAPRAPAEPPPVVVQGPPPAVWWMPWVLVGGLLGVVVFFVVLFGAYSAFVQAQRMANAGAPHPAPAAAAPAPTAAAAPDPEPAAPADPATFTIVSRPNGAVVYDKDRHVLGKTPLSVPFPEDRSSLNLTLDKPGYHDFHVLQLWSDVSVKSAVDLDPIRRKKVEAPLPPQPDLKDHR